MLTTSVPLFVNGGGMHDGPIHHTISEHPFLGERWTAPKYWFFSVGDRFPAMWLVDQGGVSVPGELDEVPLTVIREQFIPAEPEELELGVIELADGESAMAVVLRRAVLGTLELGQSVHQRRRPVAPGRQFHRTRQTCQGATRKGSS